MVEGVAMRSEGSCGAGALERARALLARCAASIVVPLRRRALGCAPSRIDALERRLLLASTLEISEFMAAGNAMFPDEDGQFDDWIEIHNKGAEPVNLAGYHLTDNPANLDQWQFPSAVLNPDSYLVVFASGKNRAVANKPLHTNFALNGDGEYLALTEPDGQTIVSEFGPAFPNQRAGISYGVDPADSKLRFFATPTPGGRNARAEVVINEIHYNPDVETELVEFIELYNPGSAAVDLTGASFTNGIAYSFPQGTSLAPGAYLVVTQDPADFQAKFGMTALGPWTGYLDNDGETITLSNSVGGTLDEVDYGLGFPWPTVGDAPGYSIELINPDFDNDLGGNWRSHAPPQGGTTQTLFASGGSWHFRKGNSEASNPRSAWRQKNFVEDSTWYTGTGPIGYDGNRVFNGSPQLSDMMPANYPNNYSSVFMRKTFNVTDPDQISGLTLEAMYDDGFVVWINGTWVYTQAVGSNDPAYNARATGSARESANFDKFILPRAAIDALDPGQNVIAVQFFNINTSGSSDAFFDGRLIATIGGGGGNSPSPGARNSVFATNAAPQMRQVKATRVGVAAPDNEQMPHSGETVAITAKITDPQGVSAVSLQYQVVTPGNYIPTTIFNENSQTLEHNPAFDQGWVTLLMRDDGTGGDATADDSIYTALIPASAQQHRNLVRYRITTSDALGASVTAPYEDDPVPNFAYYVYDGIPDWSGAIQPGSVDPTKSQVVTYDFGAMPQLPVLQLITSRSNHVESQHIPNATTSGYSGDLYKWTGTLVYNGVVYDNIHFRARGGVWRYAMGKNMWKFDFNRGHEFQANDIYGRPYGVKWTKLNLGANIQQGDYQNRGEQGLYEYIGFKLFNLAGVAAPETFPIHFRIVENTSEFGSAGNQYDDDFQGLYLGVEQMDGRFLQQHGLPDGNLYKMEFGPGGGESNNQGPTQPADNSDLISFTGTYSGNPSDQWWMDNLDLEEYYSYRSIVEGIHHGDIGYGKNYFYYHNPETNKWEVLPWDLDLTWAENMYGNGNEPFKSRVLPRPAFSYQYQNRLREIIDLLYNPEQVGLMIDEYVAMVDQPAASMVDADRAMWDYNPILASSYVNSSKAGQGRFYQVASPQTFAGMAQRMKDYVNFALNNTRNWAGTSGPSMLALAADPLIPDKPSVSYIGTIGQGGIPLDQLNFRSTAFSDASGSFASMKWRIAEITPAGAPAYDPNTPRKWEMDATWESPEITTFNSDIHIPATVVQAGKTYRVRVKMKDSTGRWSNWSNPVQFVAAPASDSTMKNSLRITELNYHPDAAPDGSSYSREDFEFVELKNIGNQAINLAGASFTDGIAYTFPDMTLSAGQKVILASNPEAFATRYRIPAGTVSVLGPFTGNLRDSGEQIRLADSFGQTILDFAYSDAWYPTTDGDGDTLVIVDEDALSDAWGQQSNWKASRMKGGTPGADESTLPSDSVVVNEAMTHTDEATGDWVELYNTTSQPIDISGWYLSDSTGTSWKYQIQPDTIIPAKGFLVFSQYAHFDPITVPPGGAPGVIVPFSFSELGNEEVVLSSANSQGIEDGYRDRRKFDAADKEMSFGRYVTSTGDIDFPAMQTATRGQPNSAPLVGPVVINEIMYAPEPGKYEYVELRNISNAAVALYDPVRPQNTWKFAAGLSYVFPQGIILQPDEYILLTSTDPATFRSAYSVPEGVRVFGPYTDKVLSDSGDNLVLVRPGDPELSGTIPWYTVDRVKYGTAAPWPTGSNATGESLQRKVSTDYGNDPINWAASEGPTPGQANYKTETLITGSAGVDTFTIRRSGTDLIIQLPGQPDQVLPLASAPSLRIVGLDGDDRLILDFSGGSMIPAGGLTFEGGVGSDSITITGTTVATGLSLADGQITVDGQNIGIGDASVELAGADSSISVGSLSISGGRLMVAGSKKLLEVQSLALSGPGTLDIADNDLVVHSSAGNRQTVLDQIQGWISSARSTSANRWLGTGLTSSAAANQPLMGLGAMINEYNGQPLIGSLAGQNLGINDILVRYCFNGDMNFDGRINADDYFRIDSGFLNKPSPMGYREGDLNYDGRIDADDYFLIDSAFLGQGTVLSTQKPKAPLFATAAITAGTKTRRGTGDRDALRVLEGKRKGHRVRQVRAGAGRGR